MELFYPVKKSINQKNLFGAGDAMYTALNQKGHPGLDFNAPSGTPLYAPCDGLAFYTTDKNGGAGIWIRATHEGQNYSVILWHMWPKGNYLYPYGIPTNGNMTYVIAGQFLGYTDNSGFPRESSGPHLHLGVRKDTPNWLAENPDNGFLGCIDPMPFFNGRYAEDIGKEVLPKIQPLPDVLPTADNISKLQGILAIWQKIKDLLNGKRN